MFVRVSTQVHIHTLRDKLGYTHSPSLPTGLHHVATTHNQRNLPSYALKVRHLEARWLLFITMEPAFSSTVQASKPSAILCSACAGGNGCTCFTVTVAGDSCAAHFLLYFTCGRAMKYSRILQQASALSFHKEMSTAIMLWQLCQSVQKVLLH